MNYIKKVGHKLLFAPFGISLLMKIKFKKTQYFLILIGLYLPDILLISLWIYNFILQAFSAGQFYINYYFLSHSFLIWTGASIGIFVVSLFISKIKEVFILIFSIFIHLSLDIIHPIINISNISIYLGLSPYHFVNLLYPFFEDSIQLAIYLPDFIVWIIDFSILFIGFIYALNYYSKKDISV